MATAASDAWIRHAGVDANSLCDLIERCLPAPLVALGEPVHGAREPLVVRNAMLRHFIQVHGFRSVILETGVLEGKKLNDFIRGGARADVVQTVRNMSWGFGAYVENVALIAWLRAFNDRAPEYAVRVYGMDISGGAQGGEIRHARRTVDLCLATLAERDRYAAQVLTKAFRKLLPRFTSLAYPRVPEIKRRELRRLLGQLEDLLAASRSFPIDERTGCIAAANQAERYLSALPRDRGDRKPRAGFAAAAAVRTAAMVENVERVVCVEEQRGGTFLFAHNAHAMNASLQGGIWDCYDHPPQTLGKYLKALFGDDLLIIGMSGGSVDPGLALQCAPRGTIDAVLAATDLDWLHLPMPPLSPDYSWWHEPQTLRVNCTTELRLVPGSAFGSLIYTRRLTPARRNLSTATNPGSAKC